MTATGEGFEVNFDGLVGPTHNYSGLSFGNIASAHFAGSVANPKAAALQGIAKMRFLHSLGIPQAFFPPQARPYLPVLHGLGFRGALEPVIADVARHSPVLLAQAYSASSMWAANAATVSPSADTADGRVHFTPANLIQNFHRSLEPDGTSRILQAIFADPEYFAHHAPLPAHGNYADEGAANHTRFCAAFDAPGVELFVYGRSVDASGEVGPKLFPARQTREASEAIARSHGLEAARTLYLRQNPDAVDQGVFHNDVIAVGHQNVLLFHAQAFEGGEAALGAVQAAYGEDPLHFLCIREESLSVADAVKTYFFNSQIVTLPKGSMAIIAPAECEAHADASACFRRIIEDNRNPISAVHYVDVRESMQNGGGPACLRLRIALTEKEYAAVHAGVKVTPPMLDRLENWVKRYYRDRLAPSDLADPKLAYESFAALEELTQLLSLEPVYFFQS